jgi:hypothetical protein
MADPTNPTQPWQLSTLQCFKTPPPPPPPAKSVETNPTIIILFLRLLLPERHRIRHLHLEKRLTATIRAESLSTFQRHSSIHYCHTEKLLVVVVVPLLLSARGGGGVYKEDIYTQTDMYMYIHIYIYKPTRYGPTYFCRNK